MNIIYVYFFCLIAMAIMLYDGKLSLPSYMKVVDSQGSGIIRRGKTQGEKYEKH
jgi:hypothetical protein